MATNHIMARLMQRVRNFAQKLCMAPAQRRGIHQDFQTSFARLLLLFCQCFAKQFFFP